MQVFPIIDVSELLNRSEEEYTDIQYEKAEDDWDEFKTYFTYRKEVSMYAVEGFIPHSFIVHRGSSKTLDPDYIRIALDVHPAVQMVYDVKVKYKGEDIFCCIVGCSVGMRHEVCKELQLNEKVNTSFWIVAEAFYDVSSLKKP
jgi:hypothetical protein